MRRLLVSATGVLAFIGAALFAADVQALSVKARVFPRVVSYYGPQSSLTTRSITSTLSLRTGSHEERLMIGFDDDLPKLSGAGRLVVLSRRRLFLDDGIAPPGLFRCAQSTTVDMISAELILPAHSHTALSITDQLDVRRASFHPERYGRTWYFRRARPLPRRSYRIRGAAPRYAGVRATSIHLNAQAVGFRRYSALRVRPGVKVTFSGRLEPLIPGALIDLYVARQAPVSRFDYFDLMRHWQIRLDDRSRFRLRGWRVPASGYWWIWATYAGLPGRFDAGESVCGTPSLDSRVFKD